MLGGTQLLAGARSVSHRTSATVTSHNACEMCCPTMGHHVHLSRLSGATCSRRHRLSAHIW